MARLSLHVACSLATLSLGFRRLPLPPKVSENVTHASSLRTANDRIYSYLEGEAGRMPALPTTTKSPFAKNATAAEMTGVQDNGTGDLGAFITCVFTNLALVIGFFIAFSILRRQLPLVYAGNQTAEKLSDSIFGWIAASLTLTPDEVIKDAGLDQAMVLEFAHLAMKLLSVLAVPLLLVMGPIHCLAGGNRSGDDYLSKLGMANVVDNHPCLYWIHGLLVWVVVVTVQRFVYTAQAKFLDRRIAWLKTVPAPRATTVLVQQIPAEHCTDAKVQKFFDHVFDKKVVESVHVVKHTDRLSQLIFDKEALDAKLQTAQFEEKKSGERPSFLDYPKAVVDIATAGVTVDSIDYYEKQIKSASKLVQEERMRIKSAVKCEDPSIFTSNAFVTFKTCRDAELALYCAYTPDDTEFVCEKAPDPADVIYEDLQKDPLRESFMAALGYGMIAGVFWAYMPIVLGIAYITRLSNLAKHFPFFRSMVESEATVDMWDAMMGSLALQLFISFVPTFFVYIFTYFFVLKAKAWLQHRIQNWYFWFQVVYVLLVTAVGSSIFATLDAIVAQPTSIFHLLATTMPFATHFYLNFVALQWAAHAQNLLRTAPLFKFLAFRVQFEEPDAKKKAEPEDQDYYGLGSRNARHSFMLALVLVFCSLTPLILALGIVNFFLCRVVYGYLTYFAETRKPDLGGAFWVTNLMNVQRCMLIYIMLMSGVLCYRDYHVGPCLIASSSAIFWYFSYTGFPGAFRWESLCMVDFKERSLRTQGTPASYDRFELDG